MLSKPPASHPDIPPTRRGMGVTLLATPRASRARSTSRPTPRRTRCSAGPPRSAHTWGSRPSPTPRTFFTEARWRGHRRGLGLAEEPLPFPPALGEPISIGEGKGVPLDALSKGTVPRGGRARRARVHRDGDVNGRAREKVAGRIGDTPSMGAGFWAEEWVPGGNGDNGKVAIGVSGTGDGDVSAFLLGVHICAAGCSHECGSISSGWRRCRRSRAACSTWVKRSRLRRRLVWRSSARTVELGV